MTSVQRLLKIASNQLSLDACSASESNRLPVELHKLLTSRNGFVAFESALVVFPSTRFDEVPGVIEWNDLNGWKRHYLDVLPKESICFAQDAFGDQFAISKSCILRMNSETGTVQEYSDSIEGWAERILENYMADTGWPLAHEWQVLHGPLSPHMRLLPRIPFVLGGEFDESNLVAVESQSAMEFLGRLYQAIREVPDGQPITILDWFRENGT